VIGDWLPIGADDVRDPLKIINDSRPSAQCSEMAAAEAKLKDYRKLVEEAQEEVASLARINYRLDIRIHELETQLQARDARIADYQKQMRNSFNLAEICHSTRCRRWGDGMNSQKQLDVSECYPVSGSSHKRSSNHPGIAPFAPVTVPMFSAVIQLPSDPLVRKGDSYITVEGCLILIVSGQFFRFRDPGTDQVFFGGDQIQNIGQSNPVLGANAGQRFFGTVDLGLGRLIGAVAALPTIVSLPYLQKNALHFLSGLGVGLVIKGPFFLYLVLVLKIGIQRHVQLQTHRKALLVGGFMKPVLTQVADQGHGRQSLGFGHSHIVSGSSHAFQIGLNGRF